MGPLQAGDPDAVGRYRLLGRLGEGGMGRVFLGRTPEGQQAAIKVIRDELAGDTGFRHRFRREVSAATAVAGMFTARVLDADPDGEPPWLATQFVSSTRPRGPSRPSTSPSSTTGTCRTTPRPRRSPRASGWSSTSSRRPARRWWRPARRWRPPTRSRPRPYSAGIQHVVDASGNLALAAQLVGQIELPARRSGPVPDQPGFGGWSTSWAR
ncbi:hypothetical protein ACVGOW_17710 [Pseudonocardia saturnea]